MQDDKFNNILQSRAKEFVLLPHANAFETILAHRKKAKRKRIFAFAAVLTFLILSITLVLTNKQHTETNISRQLAKLESKSSISEKPITSNDVIQNGGGKVIFQQYELKRNAQIINKLQNDGLIDKISNINKTNFEKGNIAVIGQVIDLNENKGLLNDYKLNSINNEVNYWDSFLIVKQVIDSNKSEDSNLVNKVIVVSEIKDSLQKDVTTKAVSVNQNSCKIKEPICLSVSVFNHYMLLNKAYNGADNELINSMFGLHYNEQANQAYSLGVMFGFSRKKLTLKVGVAYNNIQFDKLFIKPGSVGITTNIKSEALVNDYGYKINVIDQSLSFVEIPVWLGYTMGSKKVNYAFEMGLAFQYLIQTNTYLLTSDANEFSYTSQNHVGNNRFNHFQLVGQASFLVNYNLSKHISIYSGPIAKLHVNQYYKQEFTNRNAPIYIGINSGINFKF